MGLEGTVMNGVIVLDGGRPLPDGTRVRIELAEALPADRPDAPYDRETELAVLRESIEEMKTGQVRPAREVLKEIALRHNLPLEPGE